MKKINITIGVIIIVVLLVVGCYIIFNNENTGARSSVYSNTGGVLSVQKNEVGTTTPTYITSGTTATTSVEFDISGATDLALNWSLNASTTATGLYYELTYTNDESAATTDFYTVHSVASGVVSDNTTEGSLVPADSVASTTFASIPISNVIANNVKIEYNLFGANGAVTLEVAAQ